ncbi:MAG: signal peptidase I [Clostridiales bacterium]
MILKEIIDMIKNIAYGIIIALFIIQFIGQTSIVYDVSMQTSLYDGDIVWMEKITPTFKKFKRGDIVTIYSPKIKLDHGDTLVKRVVAIEGDHLLIKDGKVFVNGIVLEENYTKGNYTKAPEESKNNNIIIKSDYIYCLGDNRTTNIYDSRNMGEIDLNNITGRLLFRFYPFKKAGSLLKK